MEAADLVIRGNLVTPDGVIPHGWLAVSGGKIAAIGREAAPPARSVHDAGEAWIVPGAIDGQTHAGSYQGLKGIESTTRSAVAGGVTTIVDMPYDDPEPVVTVDLLRAKIAKVEELAHCDVALYGTIANGQAPTEIGAMAAEGICALKISAFESHPIRFPRIPADQTLDLLEAAAPTGLPVGLHNEDQEIVRARIARLAREGKNTFEWHSPSRPPAAELAATAAFLELGATTGAHVHIVHISLPRGYELVEQYRQSGFMATAEMCVHYLTFDAGEHGPKWGAKLKVNPPIRAGVRDGLWKAFDRGAIEFVSSDHSSWPVTNKSTASIFDAGAGIPGLETLVPAFYTALAKREPSPIEKMAEYLSERPARFFGLWPRKGALIVGADADVAVIEPAEWIYDASRAHDDLNWSPYDGETVPLSRRGNVRTRPEVLGRCNDFERARLGRIRRAGRPARRCAKCGRSQGMTRSPLRMTGDAHGVFVISATPFDDAGALDLASTESLIEFYLASGANGLTVLGMMGEAPKLTPDESDAFLDRVLAVVGGRVPVIVGVSNPGTDNLVAFAKQAMTAGAAGVMVAPIPTLRTEEQVLNYFADVCGRLGPDVPVVLQDYPQATGVHLSVPTIERVFERCPTIVSFKHEDFPGLAKLGALRANDAKRRRISILVGNGGLMLPQEMGRGADGAMTGFAFPEMLVAVCEAYRAGDPASAEDLFDLYLPLVRYEFQPGLGLAIRKEVLKRRGAIRSAHVRAPGPKLSAADHDELGSLLTRLENKLAARGEPAGREPQKIRATR